MSVSNTYNLANIADRRNTIQKNKARNRFKYLSVYSSKNENINKPNETQFNFNSDLMSSFSPTSVNDNNKIFKINNLRKMQHEKNKKQQTERAQFQFKILQS